MVLDGVNLPDDAISVIVQIYKVQTLSDNNNRLAFDTTHIGDDPALAASLLLAYQNAGSYGTLIFIPHFNEDPDANESIESVKSKTSLLKNLKQL